MYDLLDIYLTNIYYAIWIAISNKILRSQSQLDMYDLLEIYLTNRSNQDRYRYIT